MSARFLLGALLSVLACGPAKPPPTISLLAPVLEGDGVVSPFRAWTLRGVAAPTTIVRLYLDDRCEGPVWRDTTPTALAGGLEIELTAGNVNVFAATAVDPRGLASPCSTPVRVKYQRPPPPQRPEVRARPLTPTRETHFVITGHAADASTVRLFEGASCQGDPLATLSADDFATVGFGIDVPESGSTRVFVLDGLNLIGERSPCTFSVLLYSSRQPPRLDLRLRSPSPSPDLSAYVAVSFFASYGYVFLGTGCVGNVLARCEGVECTAVKVDFPPVPQSAWSAYAVDGLGNRSSCDDSAEPWNFDPTYLPRAVELSAGPLLRGLVPASSSGVLVYDVPDCPDLRARDLVAGNELAGIGYSTLRVFGAPDGGLVSARVQGSALSPCSEPVLRQ